MKIEPAPGRLDAARIERCHRDGWWHDETVGDLLARHASERPDAIALIDGDRRLTWSEFHHLSQRMALHLGALGIEPGDAVALQMPNWWEYLICYHSIFYAGGIVVQVGADWRRDEMTRANTSHHQHQPRTEFSQQAAWRHRG